MLRARPLLGTIVSIDAHGQVHACDLGIARAFEVIAHIGKVMSAHSVDSDLGRLALARAGDEVQVDAHTAAVMRLAQEWRRVSGGAFDAGAAARRLGRDGARPGVCAGAASGVSLADVQWLSDNVVRVPGPLALDFGGIAKGYAVDCAVHALRAARVDSGLVNAGGDLRAFGPNAWPVELRDARSPTRTRRGQRLVNAAMASSTGAGTNDEFVATGRRNTTRWKHASVIARDCVTADALTKWALQSKLPGLHLRRVLRESGAQLWRE